MQIKNANEIERLIADNQYKYLELISRNKKYGGYNATPKDLKNKVTQVKKFLSNECLPLFLNSNNSIEQSIA